MTSDLRREEIQRLTEESARVASSLEEMTPQLIRSTKLIAECLRSGGRLLVLGNGGSAAQAQHVTAELVGRLVLDRRPIPALALTTDTSILTAVGNDCGFEEILARQLRDQERPGQAGR
jgi:D-sedoheptulose 7-phosphate isomerase